MPSVEGVGARIRELRENKGYTQEQLASHAGVAVRTIRYAETGQFRPAPLTRKAIAAALGVDAEDLEAAS